VCAEGDVAADERRESSDHAFGSDPVLDADVRHHQSLIRFDQFELDLRNCQLRRNGIVVDLPRQALRILILLTARPNQLVTRKEIKEALWPGESHGDFDNRMNFAVKKLREGLGDSAEQPRYVQTVRNAGYMFVAPVRLASPLSVQFSKDRITVKRGDGAIAGLRADLAPGALHGFRFGPGAALAGIVALVVSALAFGALALRPRAGSAIAASQLASSVQISNLDGADSVPRIDWVSEILPEERQKIVIRGRGFGLHVPYSRTDTPYLAIRDQTSDWAAGRVIPENWDEVMVDVESWTSGEIVLSGFSGDYGKKGWKLAPGDQVEIAVWNPQTRIGPATFHVVVSPGLDAMMKR
jgi:DNA-binding winged helix-turn-helix (wHTH) protein